MAARKRGAGRACPWSNACQPFAFAGRIRSCVCINIHIYIYIYLYICVEPPPQTERLVGTKASEHTSEKPPNDITTTVYIYIYTYYRGRKAASNWGSTLLHPPYNVNTLIDNEAGHARRRETRRNAARTCTHAQNIEVPTMKKPKNTKTTPDQSRHPRHPHRCMRAPRLEIGGMMVDD